MDIKWNSLMQPRNCCTPSKILYCTCVDNMCNTGPLGWNLNITGMLYVHSEYVQEHFNLYRNMFLYCT